MNRALLCAGLLLLAGPAWATPQNEPPVIPERFHGDWSGDLSKCGDRESGENLSIDVGFITYFEAADTVLAVRPTELDGINIHVRHEDYDGIEETYRTLILSDDRQTLTFTSGDEPEWLVYRCPA
ncbi:hypothetical protein [Brevundimonas sp.]|uniref:hypothetical protein n=1 Tax=Brevundimonas sp. TaxID=1871086 RepID=UPI003F6E6FE6